MNKVYVIPYVFKSPNKPGDFLWMINQKQYDRILFLFNDNIRDHNTNLIGGGNACIRPYNMHGSHLPVRSSGIITGNRKGFNILNEEVMKIIDGCIDEVKALIDTGNYDAICYSSTSDEDNTIGTSIFKVDDDVKNYITDMIHSLGEVVKPDYLGLLEKN